MGTLDEDTLIVNEARIKNSGPNWSLTSQQMDKL